MAMDGAARGRIVFDGGRNRKLGRTARRVKLSELNFLAKGSSLFFP